MEVVACVQALSYSSVCVDNNSWNKKHQKWRNPGIIHYMHNVKYTTRNSLMLSSPNVRLLVTDILYVMAEGC